MQVGGSQGVVFVLQLHRPVKTLDLLSKTEMTPLTRYIRLFSWPRFDGKTIELVQDVEFGGRTHSSKRITN